MARLKEAIEMIIANNGGSNRLEGPLSEQSANMLDLLKKNFSSRQLLQTCKFLERLPDEEFQTFCIGEEAEADKLHRLPDFFTAGAVLTFVFDSF